MTINQLKIGRWGEPCGSQKVKEQNRKRKGEDKTMKTSTKKMEKRKRETYNLVQYITHPSSKGRLRVQINESAVALSAIRSLLSLRWVDPREREKP